MRFLNIKKGNISLIKCEWIRYFLNFKDNKNLNSTI